MIKKHWPLWAALIIVISIVGYFYYRYTTGPTYNWYPSYDHTSSSPYGTELLYKTMKTMFPDKEFKTIEEPLAYHRDFKNETTKNSIYYFEGEEFVPDKSTVAALSSFIHKGNQIFIAAGSVSKYFLDSLLHPDIRSSIKGQEGISNVRCLSYKPGFIHPALKDPKKFKIEFKVFEASMPMNTGFIGSDLVENIPNDYYRIGYINTTKNDSLTNYMKIKIGKGWLHLYTTPLVLTNYYLRKKEIFNHAQNLFVHLEPGNIYWHVNSYASMGEDIGEDQAKNPFGVLLSFVSFRYAWYAFCGGLLLYSLFGFKRKQRAIPVIEKNANTSIEFAETISKLYMADGRHKNIVMQKYQYFFNYVRSKFGINLKNNLVEDKKRLSYLSKVPLETIDQIMFNHIKMETLPDTNVEELRETVALINGFYKISK